MSLVFKHARSIEKGKVNLIESALGKPRLALPAFFSTYLKIYAFNNYDLFSAQSNKLTKSIISRLSFLSLHNPRGGKSSRSIIQIF